MDNTMEWSEDEASPMLHKASSSDQLQPTRETNIRVTQFLAAGAATLGAFGLGTALGWTSPANPQLENVNPHQASFTVSANQASWIGAFLNLGAMFSCPATGFLFQKIGRKSTMLVMAPPFVLGWLLMTYAQSVGMIYAGRIITGFTGGAFSVVAPVYIGEVVDPKIRGALGSCFQLMVTLGILFVYALGPYISWEWLSMACAIVPVIMAVLLAPMPESPTYYVSKANIAQAEKSLNFLRGGEGVAEELEEMQIDFDRSREMSASIKDLKKPHNLRPLIVSLGLMCLQQLSGVNAVIFYTQDIFAAAGSSLSSSISTIIVGVVQVLATVGATLLVDVAGRRVLLIISDLVMAISLLALGAFFQLQSEHKADGLGWLPVASLVVFITAFSLGFGPIPWMMMGELFPQNIKGLASATAATFNWFLAFLITLTYQSMVDSMGRAGTFFMFGGVCIAGIIFVFIFVPETKGKSLEEVQLYFGSLDNANHGHTIEASSGIDYETGPKL